MQTPLRPIALTVLVLLLICSGQRVAEAQLFDGKREGLVVGVGVGYAAAAAGGIGAAAGFTTFGRIGYGFSDAFTLYFSSSLPSIAPAIGVLYTPERWDPYYFQGTLGYASLGDDSLLSVSGGLGYEVRDHVTLEFALGFHRHTESHTHSINWWTGETLTETSQTNIITIAATLNVLPVLAV